MAVAQSAARPGPDNAGVRLDGQPGACGGCCGGLRRPGLSGGHPHDLEAGKTITTATYGGILLAVEGNYDDVNRLCSEIIGEDFSPRRGDS